MNSGTLAKASTAFLSLTAIFIFASAAASQNKRDYVKPPLETASLAETQQWLAQTIGKYASYKTRVESVTISNPKFSNCTFTFTLTRKSTSTSTAVMGATTTTNAAKYDTSVDMAKIRPDGVSVEDHIYPELQTIRLWYSGFDLAPGSTNGRVVEIVVKLEAAKAIKTALMQIQRQCTKQVPGP